MGICNSAISSKELREQIETSKRIEKELEKRPSSQLEQSVLLLGPGESGKSTVMKQIRAMGGTYTKHELKEMKLLIMQNLHRFSEMLLTYAKENCLELSEEENKIFEVMCDQLRYLSEKEGDIKAELAEMIRKFWGTNSIQMAYKKRDTFHLTDSAGYFYENLDRIKLPNYEPTNQDIVHIRVPTVGVVQAEVVLKNIRLTVCDCGGQRSERRKWYHFFDDNHAVLFVAAISEFDQVLAEDDKTNRVEEAMNLFWKVFNGKFFNKSAVILFLNKIDLFREKVKHVPINKYFPKFEEENTAENGSRFFRRQFRDGLSASFKKRMYTHETCAISDQVQMIINTVIDTVVQENLKDTGMI